MNKTNRKAKPAKPAPMKARVMLLNSMTEEAHPSCAPWHKRYCHPVAVIPTATKKQAKALADFFNLTEQERVERAAKAMHICWQLAVDREKDAYRRDARAVLRAIKGEA